MKLELSQAVPLILALPAHRSNNEGHRKMGEKAVDFLLEYRNLGVDEEEKAFNRAMIVSILSAVRAFSVERDRLADRWKSTEAGKIKREKFIDDLRELSPLAKGNYWIKSATSVLGILGVSASNILQGRVEDIIRVVGIVLIALVVIEIITIVLSFLLSYSLERKLPLEKEIRWEEESMEKYKSIIRKFIDEAVGIYKDYSPDALKMGGIEIQKGEDIERLKDELVSRCFYLG